MKILEKCIFSVSVALAVFFSILTVVTFFSNDYIRAKDTVEYLEIQHEKYANDEYSTYSEEKMEKAEEKVASIESKGIVFATIAGCSLIIVVVSILCFVKCSKNSVPREKKSKQVINNMREAISEADELKKYKDLLDDGVITQEEFEAKKKQLLGL